MFLLSLDVFSDAGLDISLQIHPTLFLDILALFSYNLRKRALKRKDKYITMMLWEYKGGIKRTRKLFRSFPIPIMVC